ncbi:MAG: CotH kinase family protein [Clostridium sp.]|nr:CotH kinase family protein [Clostridium sp.]
MYKKRAARIFLIILITFLLLLITCIDTYTVTYYIPGNETLIYQQTYAIPCWQQEIKLDTLKVETGENTCFLGWHYDKELKDNVINKSIPAENATVYAEIIEKNPETEFLLPEMHVKSNVEWKDIDRYEYNTCTYTLTNTTINNCLTNVNGKIRGRGNSTWQEFDKKSYRIKFDERQNLFGMGSDKDWVLLSNSVDYTLMRNEIALKLGQLFGLPYTSECQWIQLFYNEKYLGLYLLCEQVETGINRVNIEAPYSPEDIVVSFFVELGGELDGFTLPPVDGADNNWQDYFSCEILYPEPSVITQYQHEYIDGYMQLVNSAILTKDWGTITELIDIESFCNWYLVNEIMLNGDMGWSMFAYKPQNDKLYLGPLWDFDQSCGVSGTGGADYETWYPDTSGQSAWFNSLIEMPEFRELLSRKWKASLPAIQELLQSEKEKAVIFQQDINANFKRWPVLGSATWRIRDEIGALKTYGENVDFLFTWLDNRIHWLDTELSN